MNKEELFLINRLKDLANIAYEKNIYTYSDFLNINELSILNQIKETLPPVTLSITGGNNYAERKIAVFSPEEIYYQETIPIAVLSIAPLNSKFAQPLTHRDFLGAILNLGIKRNKHDRRRNTDQRVNKIGDIFVKENHAYIYCKEDISKYIIDNLFKIKRTTVSVQMSQNETLNVTPNFKEITGTISNIRLDSLIATAFQTARNSIINYIHEGKVFINGKLTTSNGAAVKAGDIISVRGKGRFVFEGVIKETKKGRNLIKINIYQ